MVGLVVCTALGVTDVDAAPRVRPRSVSLTADTTGVSGTLTTLVATPAGDILGADDRGLFKWSISGGWTLVVSSTTAPGCAGKKRCYATPVNSEWGDPSVVEMADGTFLVIEPTGSAGTIAINRSSGGQMSAAWESVVVSATEWVSYVCADSLVGASTLYASVGTHSTNPTYSVFSSTNAGRSWSRTAIVDTSEVCEASTPSTPPAVSDIDATSPGTLGYLGGVNAYVATTDVRMVATYGGVFASADGGSSWVPQSRGIGTHPRLRLPYTRSGSTVLIGGDGQQESALFRSVDGGATFTRAGGAPYDQPFSYIRLQSSTVAYGAYVTSDGSLPPTTGLRVHRSTNSGSTWTPINAEEVSVLAGADDTPVLIAEGTVSGSRVIVLKSYGDGKLFVTRSTDSGATWSGESEMTGCLSSAGDAQATGDRLLVPARNASNVRGYCRSVDAGVTWSFVPISSSSQFAPGAIVQQPDGSLLVLSALVPYVSTNGGASFSAKACAKVTTPIGPIVSGDFDALGALWVVYFDSSGASLPEVYRSATGGCTWDVTSVSNLLSDDDEDHVQEVEPDPVAAGGASSSARSPGLSSGPSVGGASAMVSATATASQGSRSVRLVGVGSKGSLTTTVYWGPKPSKVRSVSASSKKGTLTLKVTAPTTKGPGTLGYSSTCTSNGKKTSQATSRTTSIVHRGLSPRSTYKCVVVATNPMGSSPSTSITTKIR